jgi:hypothetical protein
MGIDFEDLNSKLGGVAGVDSDGLVRIDPKVTRINNDYDEEDEEDNYEDDADEVEVIGDREMYDAIKESIFGPSVGQVLVQDTPQSVEDRAWHWFRVGTVALVLTFLLLFLFLLGCWGILEAVEFLFFGI